MIMKDMTKQEQVQELLAGYADGLITDEECIEMCDLILNEVTTIQEKFK